LPIARQIAHAHNGSLRITDPPTGHPGGTRLVLRLPLHNRPPTPSTVRRGETGR
jgi:signal transduction histidine kinase